MSLHAILSDAGCEAMIREHIGTSATVAERKWRCTVDHYGDYVVTAPTAFDARERALDMCGIQGSIRHHVSVYVEVAK